MDQFIPGLDKGKGMYFLFVKSESKTPGVLVARPMLTSYYYKSKYFINRPFDPYTNCTSPDETILRPDSFQSMYSHLLRGLIHNKSCEWELFSHPGSSGPSSSFNKTGPTLFLTSELEISIRRSQASRYEWLYLNCSNQTRSLPTSLKVNVARVHGRGSFPVFGLTLNIIDVTVTGTISQYIPTLDFYGNVLPLVCTMYASSECYFGLNLNPLVNPKDVSYTLIPTMAYFEFLPVSREIGNLDPLAICKTLNEKEQNELVELVDVKLGHEYELVVTTYAGLYRYRIGDVLRVAGFKNKAPQFQFVCRKNVVLSIDSDKTDEVELQNAVKNAVHHLDPFDACLVDYTSYADASTIPGHYVLFWELRHGATPIPPSVFEDCCLTIEECLNSVYRPARARCVKFTPIIELLNSRVTSSYFSPKCPKWAPGHKQWASHG